MKPAQRAFSRLLLCTLAALSLSGCWPAKFNYRTAVTGTVVSAADGKPVPDAAVVMLVPRSDLVPPTSIQTAGDGTFNVPPYYRWDIASAIGESWPVRGQLQIIAPGYAAYTHELHWNLNTSQTQKLGTIKLEPLAQ